MILLSIHIYIGTDKCWLPNTAIMMKVSSSKRAACSSLNHNKDINMRSWLFHLFPRGCSEMLDFSGLDHLSPSSVQFVLHHCENSWPHSWLRLYKRHKRAKTLLKKVLGGVLLTSINHYDYNLRNYRKNESYKVLHNQEMKDRQQCDEWNTTRYKNLLQRLFSHHIWSTEKTEMKTMALYPRSLI